LSRTCDPIQSGIEPEVKVSWQKMIRRSAVAVTAAALPLAFATVIAAPASASPGLCVSGPYGYASACVDVPGVNVWYDGPRKGPGKAKHWRHHHHR
jgi:hypothetical protein